MDGSVRIDKWLWAARFYKTRNLASTAVEGGRVHVNGQRIKPSCRVKVGDVLLLTKPAYKQEVTVKALFKQRRSASEAQNMYEESSESLAQRELNVMQRKLLNKGLPRVTRKPDKHERRKLREMLGKAK